MSAEDDAGLILGSAFFDLRFYSEAVDRRFATAEDAVAHYLTDGWRDGSNPSPRFDGAYYLANNEDVRNAGVNPLAHFLRHGRVECRDPALSESRVAQRPKAPDDEAWRNLPTRSPASAPDDVAIVDVVVPVYSGYDDTLACLHAVLSAPNKTPYRLTVIDDCSPDPSLSRRLRDLAEAGLIGLLTNETNLGFVQTANRGFALSRKRDVVLLNSDTLVFGDWLDRLRFHARGAGRVATVTPFSNNATILSYPFPQQDNRQRLEIDFADLDRLFAAKNRERCSDIPSGVGFCLYVTRASLDDLGVFDERLFGRGYGAENDFCLRAHARGWRNLAAHDVFVRHTGAVSFGSTEALGKARALRRLAELYPSYGPKVAAFIRTDSLRESRTRVDVARFAALSRGRAILMIGHNWGGGIERHIGDMGKLLSEEGIPSLFLKPSRTNNRFGFFPAGEEEFPNLPEISWTNLPEAAAVIRGLDFGRAHIHSLVSIPSESIGGVVGVLREAGLEYDMTLHDYALICPRISMIDWGGTYCDTSSEDYCQRCVDRCGTPFGPQDVRDWRARQKEALMGARQVYAPSQDLIKRIARFVPERADILLRPHPLKAPLQPKALPPPRRKGVRTIGVIGTIGAHKGSGVVQSLAADALIRELPLHFLIYGHIAGLSLKDYRNVSETGAYRDAALDHLLASDPCEIAFFPSLGPETFSFSLDHAVRNGIFPVTFDIGATAARIREVGYGFVIPLETASNPGVLNDLLLSIRPRVPAFWGEEARQWKGSEAYFGPPSAKERATFEPR